MTQNKRSSRVKTRGKMPPPKTADVRRDAPAEQFIRFKPLIASLIFVLAICILYPEHVFQNKIFFAGDNQAAVSFATALQQGLDDSTAYPLWNPYLFGGMPSFGSMSYVAYVYPVSAVISVMVKYLFFTGYLWLLFHTFMTGLGTYLLLRDHGIWFFPAMTAGVLMMWMPNLVAVGANGHGSQACAVGYIPFALLFWGRLWRGKGIVVNSAALILVFGLSMLRGHLQISYYTYMVVGMHLVFFGGAKLIDGFKGNVPEVTSLPRNWFAKLTGGGKRYSAGAAITELGWASVILAVVVAASILACAVLYLPVHDYAQYSIRGASEDGGVAYDWATSWSLHPAESLTFLFPFAYGFGKDLYFGHMPFTDYPNYVGLIVVILAGLALFKSFNRYTLFLFTIVVVTTMIAFGKYFSLFYDAMFDWMPYFNKFRVPVMILIVQQLAFVLLFGFGLHKIMTANPIRGRNNAIKALAIAFLIFMVVILSQNFWPGEFADAIAKNFKRASTPQEQIQVARVVGNFMFRDMVRLSIILAAAFALFFLYYNKKLPQLVFGVLFLVVVAADFYMVNAKILHPEDFRQHEGLRIIQDRSILEKYKGPDDLIKFLKSDQRFFRIFPMDSPQRPFGGMFQSNRFMNFGISSIGGYHPAKLTVYQEFFNALQRSMAGGRFHLADMLNVRYVVSGVELPEIARFREAWRGTNYQGRPRFVYENLPAFPRAWLVGQYNIADAERTLDLLTNGTVDPALAVILEKAPAVEPESSEGPVGTVNIESYGYNKISVAVDNSVPSILVLSEVYYPDWAVQVNGQPAELLRANHILRAVALPAGKNEVVFEYDTALLEKGVTISATVLGVSMLVLLLAAVFRMRGWKRGSAYSNTNV